MEFEVFIPITMFIIIGYIVRIVSDNKVRKSIIEKGLLDENVKYLFLNQEQKRYSSSLKWGLVLIGLGLALFIGRMFPYAISEEMVVGAMFTFAGFGFLIYYFVVKKELQKQNINKTE